MPESVPIPLDLIAETQAALDAALSLSVHSGETYGQVAKARKRLDDHLSGNTAAEGVNCAKMGNARLKRKALNAIAILHEVANGLEG